MVWLIVFGALFAVWVLMNLKTSRPDGTLLPTHPYRRMLSFLQPTKNESYVLYDDEVRVDELEKYVAEVKERFHCDMTHCVVAACAIGLHEAPKMNRFVNGRRLYQRKFRKITFSMKRKKLDKEAKVSAVQMFVEDGETFRDFVQRVNEKIGVERTDKQTYTDKELDLFLKLPRPILNVGIKLLKWLDYHNVLPWSFIKNDPMYASMFVANLGSLGMRAGYHHLYEWGNAPLFLMVGRTEERPVVEDGEIVVRRVLPLRYTYDERIDDGLNADAGIAAVRRALENPYTYFGCLKDDGSDARPLDAAPE